MAGSLDGKVAIVTGVGDGIGVAVARAFAAEGASLVVSRRSEENLTRIVGELEGGGATVVGVVADVRRRADADHTIATAVDRFGRLDVLVNNAQAKVEGTLRDLATMDDETIALYLESGLLGTFYHMQAAFPHLKDRGGSIINFGSREGIVGGVGFAAYAAAKEGVRGLSRVAAREWGPHKIRVNVLCPAALSPSATKYLEQHPDRREMYLRAISLGYFGDPGADIAPVAVFLASDQSAYVTGQTLNVDGGQVML